MPDKEGEMCGVFFQNLVIPKELMVKDSNCCFSFLHVPNNMVYICGSHQFRCARSTRIMIKKFFIDCKQYFRKNGFVPPVLDASA